VQLEGLGQLKKKSTSSGLEPTTFRLMHFNYGDGEIKELAEHYGLSGRQFM
jgi:hypothetical protein